MTQKEIRQYLPYSPPFLFVDELTVIGPNGITGNYTYRKDEYFYKGHFKKQAVTPGVILTETMAQIGLVCLGIYLLKDELQNGSLPALALSSAEVEFLLSVFPGEKVTVVSRKKYFRFNKLKCEVEMQNGQGKIVCRGVIAGLITKTR